jgi:hypothetical protein
MAKRLSLVKAGGPLRCLRDPVGPVHEKKILLSPY